VSTWENRKKPLKRGRGEEGPARKGGKYGSFGSKMKNIPPGAATRKKRATWESRRGRKNYQNKKKV